MEIVILVLIGLAAATYIAVRLTRSIKKSDCGSCCNSCAKTCSSAKKESDD